MFTAVLIALIAQQGSAPPAPLPPELRVVVAAPVYHPDGSVSGETVTLPGTAPSVRYLFSRRSLCDTTTTAAAEPRDGGFGWRVAVHVVSMNASEVVVSVDWRRMWDRGQALATGPGGTTQLTLHLGDRIPLDHIQNALPSDACRAVGMGLEVRLGRAPAPTQSGRMTLPLGAREGGAGLLDLDLWLVHTTPIGGEQAQHQKVRLSANGGPFTFAPVKFTTTQGEVGVELNGSFQRYTAAGGEYLLVGMSRIVTGAMAPSGGHTGATSSLVALPRPDEVLAFEMTTPGAGARGGGVRARGGGGGGGVGAVGSGTGAMVAAGPRGGGGGPAVAATLDGHRFALRVRVTPVSGS